MKLTDLLYLIMCFCCLPACGQQNLEKAVDKLYKYTVPVIQPQKLETWRQAQKKLVLIDSRSVKEFEVSHLEGSELIDFENFNPGMVSHIPKSSLVVVYCSVGYRSERIGERMIELGFTEVYNLYGGLFHWKNQGLPVVNNQNQETDSIHAYNQVWGTFLKKGIKVYD